MSEKAPKPVQYFSKDYLERCREMSPEEVVEFLEGFRLLTEGERSHSRLISLKVPETLLEAFRLRCKIEGVKYQTQIKRLMADWLQVENAEEADSGMQQQAKRKQRS